MLGCVTARFEKHGLKLGLLAAATLNVRELGLCLVVLVSLPGVHLLLALPKLLGQGLELTEAGTLVAVVHQSLDGLFALKAARLELVEWSIHDLAINALNLAVLRKVDLNVV